MATGSGTSFNQPYNTINGSVMSNPYPSNIGGNIALYEKGAEAISTNYAPNISKGGKKTRKSKKTVKGKKYKNKTNCKYGRIKRRKTINKNQYNFF